MNSLESEVITLVKSLDIPGAVVSLKSDVYDSFTILHGYSDIKTLNPMCKQDIFRIASITKIFTGIIIRQLSQEGLIDLDMPISEYLAGIPNGDGITIRQIAEMRSGIADYDTQPEFVNKTKVDPYRYWLPAELLSIGITAPVLFAPGTQFSYSNTNAIILGLVIERITGNSIGFEMHRRIMIPLGLDHTKFQMGNAFQVGADQTVMHAYDKELVDVTYQNLSGGWAAGAITSNLEDLTKFGEYLIKIIGEQTWTSHFTSAHYKLPAAYGFLLYKIGNFIGHNGGVSGYNSVMLCEPNTGTILITATDVFETGNDISDPATMIAEFIISKLNAKHI
jgi:D-alanyl-D-alanine carboxypeptidase